MKDPIYHRIFDYDRNLLPNKVLRELESDVTNIDQAMEKSGLTIGYPGWGLIYYLVMTAIPRDREVVIIETGSNYGCSTIVLAQALKDAGANGRVYSIELDEDNHRRATGNVARAELDDIVTLVQGDSLTRLPEVLRTAGQVDVAFLDGSHLHQHVVQEFKLVQEHLTDRGLVLFDNTYPIAEPDEDQRVYGALKDIQQSAGGNLVYLDFVSWYTPGLAMWQQTPPERRS